MSSIDLREKNLGKQPLPVGITLCLTAREHYLMSCEIIWKVFLLNALVCGACDAVAIALRTIFHRHIVYLFFSWRSFGAAATVVGIVIFGVCAVHFSSAFVCVRVIQFIYTMEYAKKTRAHKTCSNASRTHTQCTPFVYFNMFVQTNIFLFFSSTLPVSLFVSWIQLFPFSNSLLFWYSVSFILFRFSQTSLLFIHGSRLFASVAIFLPSAVSLWQ